MAANPVHQSVQRQQQAGCGMTHRTDRDERLETLRKLEASLLGRMLIPHDFYTVWAECIALGLEEKHFFHPAHKHLFRELNNLRKDIGKPSLGGVTGIGPATVFEWLVSRGTTDTCGGLVYVSSLSNHTPEGGPCGAIRYTITRIKDHAARRQALEALTEARAKVADTSEPLEEALIYASKKIVDSTPADTGTRTKTASRVSGSVMQSINKPPKNRRIRTGINELDWVLNGGFETMRLALLAGRPGHGKTALALNLLRNFASSGVPVFFLSLEMKATFEEEDEETGNVEEHAADLATRLMAIESGVPVDAIKAMSTPDEPYPEGRDPDQDYEALHAAHLRFSQWPLEIEDDSSLTWPQVEARIRRAKARNPGLMVVALDYVGLIKKRKGEDVQAMLDVAADGLASLANELQVLILCLAQLNRKCEERADKRPEASDMRNSGKLEQAAAHLVFVQRPCKYEAWAGYEDVFWVKEGKGRHGKHRDLCIQFDGTTQRVFGPAAPDPVRASFGTTGQIEDDDQGVGGSW